MLVPVDAAGKANSVERKNSASESSPPTLSKKPEYDSAFTDLVIAATGPKANPRLAQIMPSLVRHLHDFAREVDLTVAEWTAGVDMVRDRVHPATNDIHPSIMYTHPLENHS